MILDDITNVKNVALTTTCKAGNPVLVPALQDEHEKSVHHPSPSFAQCQLMIKEALLRWERLDKVLDDRIKALSRPTQGPIPTPGPTLHLKEVEDGEYPDDSHLSDDHLFKGTDLRRSGHSSFSEQSTYISRLYESEGEILQVHGQAGAVPARIVQGRRVVILDTDSFSDEESMERRYRGGYEGQRYQERFSDNRMRDISPRPSRSPLRGRGWNDNEGSQPLDSLARHLPPRSSCSVLRQRGRKGDDEENRSYSLDGRMRSIPPRPSRPPLRDRGDQDWAEEDEEYSCFDEVRVRYMPACVPRSALRERDGNLSCAPTSSLPSSPTCRGIPQGHRGKRGKDKENNVDLHISPFFIAPAVRRKPVPHYTPTRLLKMSALGLSPDRPPPYETTPAVGPTPRRLAFHKSLPFGTQPSVSINKFSLKHVLGAGAQGRVYLAKGPDKRSSNLYAVKVMDKKKLMGGIRTVLEEQEVLKQVKGHPFILELEASFHDARNFYLVMEYHSGGDLQRELFNCTVFDVDQTRFYASELVLAINYLHKNGIIHRDLKLANVLLKSDGHIAVADFGLAKAFRTFDDVFTVEGSRIGNNDNPTTMSACGTPCYMAPEMLSRKPYSYEVDWWAFGVMIYTMLEGELPWMDKDVRRLRVKICNEPLPYRSVIEMDADAKSFIDGLLVKDPRKRMGVSAIFSSPFFSDVNWDDVELLNTTPPYIPRDEGEMLAEGCLLPGQYVSVGDIPIYDPYPEYNFVGDGLREGLDHHQPSAIHVTIRDHRPVRHRRGSSAFSSCISEVQHRDSRDSPGRRIDCEAPFTVSRDLSLSRRNIPASVRAIFQRTLPSHLEEGQFSSWSLANGLDHNIFRKESHSLETPSPEDSVVVDTAAIASPPTASYSIPAVGNIAMMTKTPPTFGSSVISCCNIPASVRAEFRATLTSHLDEGQCSDWSLTSGLDHSLFQRRSQSLQTPSPEDSKMVDIAAIASPNASYSLPAVGNIVVMTKASPTFGSLVISTSACFHTETSELGSSAATSIQSSGHDPPISTSSSPAEASPHGMTPKPPPLDCGTVHRSETTAPIITPDSEPPERGSSDLTPPNFNDIPGSSTCITVMESGGTFPVEILPATPERTVGHMLSDRNSSDTWAVTVQSYFDRLRLWIGKAVGRWDDIRERVFGRWQWKGGCPV